MISYGFERKPQPHWGVPSGYRLDEWGLKVDEDDEEREKVERTTASLERIVANEQAKED